LTSNKASQRQRLEKATEQSALRLAPPTDEHLDISTLETWLWDAACAIRGATDAPKFKDFILPLIFYKRLSDVFDDKLTQLMKKSPARSSKLTTLILSRQGASQSCVFMSRISTDGKPCATNLLMGNSVSL
jgi:hypothetical protein